mmetsp:Transcript_11061/g.28327  ORF Transcript_11061/g.28327 Transcript_11061/m.28327 type:complete len:290 (+) Transcript_11061:32-901(+)
MRSTISRIWAKHEPPVRPHYHDMLVRNMRFGMRASPYAHMQHARCATRARCQLPKLPNRSACASPTSISELQVPRRNVCRARQLTYFWISLDESSCDVKAGACSTKDVERASRDPCTAAQTELLEHWHRPAGEDPDRSIRDASMVAARSRQTRWERAPEIQRGQFRAASHARTEARELHHPLICTPGRQGEAGQCRAERGDGEHRIRTELAVLVCAQLERFKPRATIDEIEHGYVCQEAAPRQRPQAWAGSKDAHRIIVLHAALDHGEVLKGLRCCRQLDEAGDVRVHA